MSALSFEGIAGGYGGVEVVRGISGAVAAGEVLCVLGRNGVGKTTLMKLLLGYLPARAGTVKRDGEPLGSLGPSERYDRGISYCPQERPVFDNLTVQENLTLMARGRGLDRYAEYFRSFPVLERRLDQMAGTLSGGEKKMLSITRGLAEGKPVVVLDEPSEGVQWENILRMAELIEARRAAGTAFIVVEQNLEFAQRIASRYLVMDQGRAVLEGAAEEIDREAILRHLHV